uniref:Uncharacterized protein n=1 Tax=Sphaerodactylus townsendi TaxID=933632 RepID=A0ACB8ECV0_9SAUR
MRNTNAAVSKRQLHFRIRFCISGPFLVNFLNASALTSAIQFHTKYKCWMLLFWGLKPLLYRKTEIKRKMFILDLCCGSFLPVRCRRLIRHCRQVQGHQSQVSKRRFFTQTSCCTENIWIRTWGLELPRTDKAAIKNTPPCGWAGEKADIVSQNPWKHSFLLFYIKFPMKIFLAFPSSLTALLIMQIDWYISNALWEARGLHCVFWVFFQVCIGHCNVSECQYLSS